MSTGTKAIIWIIVIAIIVWGGYEFLKSPTNTQNGAAVEEISTTTTQASTAAPMIPASTTPFTTPDPDAKG